MDQVSVIFQPGALRKFTKIPYEELMQDPDVMGTIFGKASRQLVEKLFCTDNFCERVTLLDEFLLNIIRDKHRQQNIDRLLRRLDFQINSSQVFDLALSQHMDASTLYRQFKYHVGQSPKEYLKVVRFRKALHALQNKHYNSLTQLSYDLGYFDQSHFIKEFSRFTHHAPGLILKSAEIVDNKIIWITSK
jgi:AraC-like DNA-binding protein